MLNRKLIIILFLVLSFFNSNAQKFELGKVSLKELQEKTCPSDTNAVAAILYNKAKTTFIYDIKKGFSVVHEYEFRIKIYKTEGLNWANKKVSYYIGYENINADILKFSNAVTYNIENGAIIKTKLNGEGTFKNNVNKYWNEASIAMANVKVGSVIEYKYTIKSENVVQFPVNNFQYNIPVNYSEYSTEIPEFFIYKPILTGFFKINSNEKIENGYQSYSDEYNRTLNMSYQQINTVFKADNIPALNEESYVDNLENYRATVHYELDRTRFPEVPEKNYSTTWEGVAKIIYKDKDFGIELQENTYLIQDLRAILKDATTDLEKMNIVFKFIQNKMNWNNFYGYTTDKGVKKAYQDGTGNIAEINFILISMLNYAGINANPVLVSTVSHGIPVYPNRTVFNYVIAAVDIDGNRILLDATNKKTTTNILPFNVLNWTGRLIRQDGSSEEINLVPKITSKENNNLMVLIDKEGNVSGKARIQKTDYYALRFRETFADLNKENYLEKLENNWNGMQIKEYTIENSNTDLSKPVVETFSFFSNNHVEIINNKIYINPLLFLTNSKNPFKQEKRELPIYFGFPTQEKFNISYEIPEGFIIESIPKSITFTSPDNLCVFSIKIISNENKIQVAVSSEINLAIMSSDYYEIIKDFYQKMIDKQNEKIVLVKK